MYSIESRRDIRELELFLFKGNSPVNDGREGELFPSDLYPKEVQGSYTKKIAQMSLKKPEPQTAMGEIKYDPKTGKTEIIMYDKPKKITAKED